MEYDLARPWRTLDPWQKEILKKEGNITVRSGRQVGKSTIIAIKAGEYAVKNPNKTIMIIASVERQALLLFEKVLAYIHTKYRGAIKKEKNNPTKKQLKLNNGSKILSLPTGETGYGIRGFTVNLLIADEAAYIPEEVWLAVTPMLAVTKGRVWLLSTPRGREGYFYRSFSDKRFSSFHVSSEDCPRKDDAFLLGEKERLTKAQYAQEYLGEFVDELHRFFPDTLINRCCTLKRPKEVVMKWMQYFLGVDVARMGADESTFEIIQIGKDGMLRQVENITTRKTLTTATTNTILELNKKYRFNKIYIDDGGMGVAVFDNLLEKEDTRRKVIPLNNAQRGLDYGKTRKKKLLKEDLYNNMLRLMEQKKVQLLDDNDLRLSLRSIQYEYTDKGMRIFGNYSHITEGLIRALWCVKDKGLNIFITYV
jgi:hypothetical protein